jgi:polysaccharide export outer membrane protein
MSNYLAGLASMWRSLRTWLSSVDRPRTSLSSTGAALVSVRQVVSVLAICSLAACSMAPGMSFRDSTGNTGASDRTTAGGGGANASGSQTVPAGNTVEITDDLVAKQQAALPTTISPEVKNLFGTPHPYVLGPGDVLSIVVWDHPELTMPAVAGANSADAIGAGSVSSGYTVDNNGKIQFAYVGMLPVQGLTESEAREALATKLGKYLRDPQVTLRIQVYRSKRVYVDGEVRTPGLQMLNDSPMTLPEAINRAGGFTTTADRSTIGVTRGDLTVKVNIPDLIAKGINPSQILLRDGDMVRVFAASDSKVFVLGEVVHASTISLNNGRLTLNEALGDAGGINQNSGDAKQVYVVRGKGQPKPTVYHLDASTPAAMALADNFELKPNDVVFVDASSLVRWSRVFSLLLPTGPPGALSTFIP